MVTEPRARRGDLPLSSRFAACGAYDRERADAVMRFRQWRAPVAAGPILTCGVSADPQKWHAFYAKRVHLAPKRSNGIWERLALCWFGTAVTNTRTCWPAAAARCLAPATRNCRCLRC